MSDTEKPNNTPRHDYHDSSTHRWQRLVKILLVCYVVALMALAYLCSVNPSRWDSPVWIPENSTWMIRVAIQIGSSVTRDFFLFLALGFLSGAASAPRNDAVSLFRVMLNSLLAFGLSSGMAFAVRTIMNGTPIMAPTMLGSLLLVLPCLWGSWLGTTWMSNGNPIGWMVKQILLAGFVTCGGGVALSWLAFSSEPLEISSAPISTDDRRRLVKLFRAHDPRDLKVDETTELTLTEHDLNQLASWGLSWLPSDHRVELGISYGEVSMKATFQLPPNPALHRHLNLTTVGRLITRDGELGFWPRTFELGRMRCPAWLLNFTGPIIIGSAWRYEATEPFLRSLHSIEVTEDTARIAFGHLDMDKGLLRDALVGLGMLDVESATRAHVVRLTALAEQNPRLSFEQCIETAFSEAKRRSEDGQAIRENRAAILAMGYVLGHPRIKTFLGQSIPAPSNQARQRFLRVNLRNRTDWRQHFTLSAALQVLANALLSMDAGILKEELDAGGGTGFSFGDLLADRAGTMLAVKATESESAAKAMQIRIADGFVVADFMPDGSDLPEGISDQHLNTQFGGVGGVGYTRLLAEIDRRIAECPAYRTH